MTFNNLNERAYGKIDSLPIKIKKEVESKLLAGFAYEDIAFYLRLKGYDIHFSTIGRYGRRYPKKRRM